MVDAAGDRIAERPVSTGSDDPDVLALSGEDAIDLVGRMRLDGPPTPAQHPLWIASWIRHSGADSLVAFVLDRGHPVLALPLERVRRGPVSVACYLSGSHANGNCPLIGADLRHAPEILAARLVAHLRESPSGIDLLHLERQGEQAGRHANPFLPISRIPSADPALAVRLEGGFEAVLSRHSGKRKAKKHRSQLRKFGESGGWRRFRAASAAEADRCLEACFDMKAARFAALGIADPFAAPGIRSFFRHLFADALSQDRPPFVLHGLEVAGVLRAVTGSSISGTRLVCEFTGFADDELAQASPGDFLFHENIREACDAGLSVFDFSVGDQAYKRQWCDIEVPLFDSLVPLTARGRAAALALRAATRARRAAKSSTLARNIVARLRRPRAPEPDSG
jgi:CelD/BcsL family acetyltransferase involved in cellulose biosynthesis